MNIGIRWFHSGQVARGNESTAGSAAAFTLSELMVTLATLGILVVMVLPTLGSAKINSRQLSCLNNLRQLGIATRMYVVEYQQYPGSYSPQKNVYVWPNRLLDYTDGQRKMFACPAAIPSSRWATNLNGTLGSGSDVYAVTPKSRFSYGINDWGLSSFPPQLGLGGDVDGSLSYGPVRDGDVVAPSQMIMLGDVPAPANAALINFGANLDPTDQSLGHTQWPSNRHQYQTDFVFTDGHTETPMRPAVINPTAGNVWRSRWNNDDQPHNEFTWTVNSAVAAAQDPSY